MRRVLITGFEVFSKHSKNISEDLVLTLPNELLIADPWGKSRPYDIASIEVKLEKEILSVDENGSRRISSRIDSGDTWDAIIHLGLCGSCEIPRVELVASNILDMRIPDNLGRLEKNTKLGEIDKKIMLNHDFIFSEIIGQEFELSTDAGNFICNETYFYTLKSIEDRGLEKRMQCLFLHLPDYQYITLNSCSELLKEIIGRTLFKPVMPVAAGVIIHDSEFLLARRNDNFNDGFWEFPGGKLNFGESASQAVERELKEEFDWDVISLENLGTWHHIETEYDIELKVFRCRFNGDNPNFLDKRKWTSHDQIKWISDPSEVSPYVGSDQDVARHVSKLI